VPTLEQVLEKNPDTVKVVFKHFPIRTHKFAVKAAMAALAAERQGKFWEYHDMLFENYRSLNDEKATEIAKNLQLDMEAFEKERKDPSLRAKINQDLMDGINADVRGTPTVLINGRSLRNRSLEGFQAATDAELARGKQETQNRPTEKK